MKNSDKSKKILISGYIGFHNFGDDLIFNSLVNYLKSKSNDENPLEITAFSSNIKETTEKYGVSALNYKKISDILKGIYNCDVLISGGGSLLQDVTSKKSIFYYLSIIFLAKLLFKKVIIFAQGLDGINSPICKFITKIILKKCDLVTVRDKFSLNIAKKWKLNPILVCDPFYEVNVPEYKPDGAIGVQVRSSINLFPLFLDNFARYLTAIYPHNKFYIYVFQTKTDEETAIALMMHMKNYNPKIDVEIVINNDHFETIREFSHLQKLYAMRFHACLLGIKYGMDVMPIAYDFKVAMLANEYELNYIDCSVEQNLKNILKSIKKPKQIEKKFDWSLYDKFIIKKEQK